MMFYTSGDQTRCLIFIHNPKSAGTSISRAIGIDMSDKGKYRRHIPHHRLMDCDKKLPSFGFVRNPWDRMRSMYRWFCPYMEEATGQICPFDEWLKADEMPWTAWLGPVKLRRRPWLKMLHRYPQTWWLDGVTMVGRYENLEEDLKRIAVELDFPLAELERLNSSHRLGPYQKFYTDETRELVAQRFASDIERWGYEF